jgi:hypothetical protein
MDDLIRKPHPLRVVVKALILFALANLLFAYFNPAVGKLSIFNHLVNGRLRFPAQTQETDQFNQGVLSFQDLDSMFASHVISAAPKPKSEYRVILLGDSSIWGYTLQASDILSEQLNKMNLLTCAGKTVRVYDLAYPLPSFMRDLLILDQARQYQPDLVVWPVTMLTFLTNDSDRFFLAYQADRVLQLTGTYHLMVPAASHLHVSGFWDRTILAQRSRIKVVSADQLYGLRWEATDLDIEVSPAIPLSNDVASDSFYYGYNSSSDLKALVKSFQFSSFDAGQKLAGKVPIYYFNEPIFISDGKNSSVRYNKYYPRWAYDEYRTRIGQWMSQQDLPYDDFWNLVPASEFTDSPLHLTAEGENQLAEKLAPAILKMACK